MPRAPRRGDLQWGVGTGRLSPSCHAAGGVNQADKFVGSEPWPRGSSVLPSPRYRSTLGSHRAVFHTPVSKFCSVTVNKFLVK